MQYQYRMCTSVNWILTCAVILAGLATAQVPDLSKMDIVERSVPDGPVAMVDGQAVASGDFLFLYKTQLLAMSGGHGDASKLTNEARLVAGLNSLRGVVEREIMYQESLRRKITVTDQEVTTAYQERLATLKGEMAKQGGAKEATEEQVLAEARQTRQEALDAVRKTLAIDKTREAIVRENKSPVTDADVKEYYEARKEKFRRPGTIHLAQIFVKASATSKTPTQEDWDRSRKKMDTALARIRAGESFEAVAREISEAPGRDKGGDMGPLPESGLPPFYLDAAKTMQTGQLSDVIKSELGWHVIKLIERDAGGEITFEQAQDRIKNVLSAVKEEDLVGQFCQKVYDEGRISFFIDLESKLAALPGFKERMQEQQKNAAKQEGAPAAKPVAAEPKAMAAKTDAAQKKTAPAKPAAKAAATTKKAPAPAGTKTAPAAKKSTAPAKKAAPVKKAQ